MNVIFDMGGVLAQEVDVIPQISQITGISPSDIRDFSGVDFHSMSEGAMTAQEYWNLFNTHFGTNVEGDLIAECFKPVIDHRMLYLIDALKAGGNRVVCGTNTLESHYRIHRNRGDYDSFHQVYASHLIGITKPDPRFYTHILDTEGWKPEDCLFVDDRRENTETAQALGIQTWTYVSTELGFQEFVSWICGIAGARLPEAFCPH